MEPRFITMLTRACSWTFEVAGVHSSLVVCLIPRPFVIFCNVFYDMGCRPLSDPQYGGLPLVSGRLLIFNLLAAILVSSQFIHSVPEDLPCCGEGMYLTWDYLMTTHAV
jgi:hypothetical protein